MVLAMLILLNLSTYLGKANKPGLGALEQRFRLAVAAKSVGSLAGAAVDGSSSADTFREIELATVAQRKSDVEAESLYVAAKVARTGAPVDAKEAPLLAKKSGGRFAALRGAFLAPIPSTEVAKELVTNLGERPVDAFARSKLNRFAGLSENGVGPEAIRLLLGGAMVMGVFGLGALAIILGLAYLKNAGPATGFAVGPITLPQADGMALLGALQMLTFVAASILGSLLIRGLPKSIEPLGSIVPYAMMAGGIAWMSRTSLRGRRISLANLGLRRLEPSHLLWGVGGAFANAPIVLLMGFLGTRIFSFLPPPEHPITIELQSGLANPLRLISVFAIASLFAPFLEETMFRGTLTPAFSRVFGSVGLGVLTTSFFFASIHPTGIPAWPALMAVGAMGAFLAYRTGSLWPSVIMHGVHNFGTLILALLTS
jgi:membrane protease YdiL (CAAX protease family)